MLTIPAAAKLSLYLQINVVRIRIIFDPDPLSPKTDPYKKWNGVLHSYKYS